MKAIGDEAIKTVAVAPVTENVVLRAEAPAAGAYYLLADSGQEALLEARVRLSRFKVEAAEAKFTSDGREYPAGSWILADQPGLAGSARILGGEPRASVRRGGGRARRRAPRARPAAARRAADLDRHAVGRLGADDLRRSEGALHADHGRRRAEGRPALALRRDPLPGDRAATCVESSAASTRSSGRSPTRRPRSFPLTARRPPRRTSPAASPGRASPTSTRSCARAACCSRSAARSRFLSTAASCAT